MQNLSKIAQQNPIKARLAITLAHIILPFLAVYFGGLLYDIGRVLPVILIPILVVIFFFAYYFYPNKKQRKSSSANTYRARKSLDFIFVMIYFLLIATDTNDVLSESPPADSTNPTSVLIVATPYQTVKEDNIFTKSKKKFRQLKKQIVKEIRGSKKSNQNPPKGETIALKVLLIILTLALAVGLGYLIFALGCNLACSGNEGLAWVVWVGGFLGLAVGLFFVIRSILRIDREKPKI